MRIKILFLFTFMFLFVPGASALEITYDEYEFYDKVKSDADTLIEKYSGIYDMDYLVVKLGSATPSVRVMFYPSDVDVVINTYNDGTYDYLYLTSVTETLPLVSNCAVYSTSYSGLSVCEQYFKAMFEQNGGGCSFTPDTYSSCLAIASSHSAVASRIRPYYSSQDITLNLGDLELSTTFIDGTITEVTSVNDLFYLNHIESLDSGGDDEEVQTFYLQAIFYLLMIAFVLLVFKVIFWFFGWMFKD